MQKLLLIGGGVAGAEAAWQAARLGFQVDLIEMRPASPTPAHISPYLAELICSNSFGSTLPDRASGILYSELVELDSLLIRVALETRVPAGHALSVDRVRFASKITHTLETHPSIHIIREEAREFPTPPAIIATGPLTSPAFCRAISAITGKDNLYFYDAISPSVLSNSLDHSIVFQASRYGKGVNENGDYLNCPFNENQYMGFIDALVNAQTYSLREYESAITSGVRAGHGKFFEGCLPVEIMAARDKRALAFGPLRPVGLRDPRDNRRPYAVAQLRQENSEGTTYNIVGFQTNLIVSEQKRVFRMIPGLENAEFTRFGQMHRNTYLASPVLLLPSLMLRSHPGIFIAGQLSGIEGYLGNIASGLLAGINAARFISGKSPLVFPRATMLGSLCHAICETPLEHFQPVKANLGLVERSDSFSDSLDRRKRSQIIAQESSNQLASFISKNLK